jgi:hypothetical protein
MKMRQRKVEKVKGKKEAETEVERQRKGETGGKERLGRER